VDRAVDSAATQQPVVGGVDDSIDIEGGDIAFDDTKIGGHVGSP
tara:strand:- start:2993 stop:3124 length:132 start_codon:yes stop_codon:yes gene_type:complete